MREEIAATLARVAATLPPVSWAEAGEIRRIGQARRRRRAVVAAVAVVAMVAVGSTAVRSVSTPDPAATRPTSTAPTCPDGLKPAMLNLPDFAKIRIRVYNGTGTDNLAAQVGTQLSNRGLNVLSTQTAPDRFTGVALIRYGPSAVGAAWVMRSFFTDTGTIDFRLDRVDDVVDVVLGDAFQSLNDVTQVNRSIALLGRATAPPGTCAAG